VASSADLGKTCTLVSSVYICSNDIGVDSRGTLCNSERGRCPVAKFSRDFVSSFLQC
jgi:hypothetical protein